MKTTKTKKIKPVKWGEVRDSIRHYPLHRFQKLALQSNSRLTFCFAGTGGGKSCILPLWILQKLSSAAPKSRILVVSPTYKIFKQSQLLQGFESAIDGTELQGQYHKTDSIYTCRNKSEVYFRSADVPDSLEGGQYFSLALDEVAKISKDAWVKAYARVGQSQGSILGVGTPDVNEWIYDDIYSHCQKLISQDDDGSVKTNEDGSISVIQWRSTANPVYSRKELEEQREKMHPALFARRYLGQFSQIEGLVYPTFSDCVIPFQNILNSPAVKVIAGLDWGWNDPCSLVVVAECQDGRAYVVEELYESHLPLESLSQRLHALKQKWNIETFFCDHSRPEISDSLRRTGLPCKTKNVAQIETGISMVDARVRTGHLRVFDTCRNLINESKIYQRKPDKNSDYTEKPVDKNNHLMDSLRYAITGLDFGRRLNFQPVVDISGETAAVDAKVRLGILPDDPEAQRIIELENRKKLYAQHFYNLAWGDLDD